MTEQEYSVKARKVYVHNNWEALTYNFDEHDRKEDPFFDFSPEEVKPALVRFNDGTIKTALMHKVPKGGTYRDHGNTYVYHTHRICIELEVFGHTIQMPIDNIEVIVDVPLGEAS